jgi:hypothetical protein
MSEIITSEGVNQAVGNIATGVTTAFYWILALLVIATAIIGVWWFLRFKHRVRVRKVIKNGRSIPIDDKARVYKDNDGAVWWIFRKTGIKVAEPSNDALEVGQRGKIHAEGYLLADGNFIWRNNDLDINKLKELQKDEAYSSGYDALTSQERALYAKELRDSESYKKKKLSELILMALPFVTVIIVIVLTFVLIGEAIEPARQLGAEIKASTETLKEAMQIVKDVVQNRETMWLENSTVVAPN